MQGNSAHRTSADADTNVTLNPDTGVWSVAFEGKLTESLRFPEIPPEARSIVVDLGKVEYINSMGVRSWILWAKSLAAASLKIEVKCAPLPFMRLLSFIHNMIPPGAYLRSYFVSFSCIDCSNLHDIEIENRANLDDASPLILGLELPNCSACGHETELEMPPSFYQSLGRMAPDRE